MQQLIWRGIGDGSREDPFVLQIPKGARFDPKDAFNIYFETNYIGFKHSESYIKIENRFELYLIGSLVELNGTLLIKMKKGINKTLFLSDYVNAVDGVYYLTQVEGVDYVLKQQSYSIYEVDDFDLEVELEGLETDTVIVTADKIKGSKFTLSADVKINTLENELLVKTEDGLYVKRDDTKLNAKPDGTNDLIVDDKVNPFYLPDITGLVNIDGVTIVNNDDNELAVAPTIITKLEGIEEGAQVNPYDKATLDSWKTNIDDNTADIADLETNKATTQDIINLISMHNNDTEAHSYILRLIATVQAGIAKALVFDTNAQLETWLTDRTIIHQGYLPEDLLLGQGIYTLPENEVDYWVSELPVNTIADLTPLHGKIDLSNYALLTDLSALRDEIILSLANYYEKKSGVEIEDSNIKINGAKKIDIKNDGIMMDSTINDDFSRLDQNGLTVGSKTAGESAVTKSSLYAMDDDFNFIEVFPKEIKYTGDGKAKLIGFDLSEDIPTIGVSDLDTTITAGKYYVKIQGFDNQKIRTRFGFTDADGYMLEVIVSKADLSAVGRSVTTQILTGLGNNAGVNYGDIPGYGPVATTRVGYRTLVDLGTYDWSHPETLASGNAVQDSVRRNRQLEATPDMTERVGINAEGQLVTKPAETGGEEFSLYKNYASDIYYDAKATDAQFNSAWEHSLTVTVPNKAAYPNADVEGIIIKEGVTSISGGAFYYWPANNQQLVIPNSVTSIGHEAFSIWSTNNQQLVIPNSVTSISGGVFSSWEANNQQLVIPNSVINIGQEAFSSWEANNQQLVIPNSVINIGQEAFAGWSTNNQQLVIPNSVINIGDYAFDGWTVVPYVVMTSIVPPSIGSNAFGNQNDAPIYVPNEVLNDYKTATNWIALASRIKPISELRFD